MIRIGLTSITLRQLDAASIIQIAKKAGLDCVEWGGDIHVPHGNIKTAREVSQMSADANIAIRSYGSYYVLGKEQELPFEKVLETAIELKALTIRVWAGDKASDEADKSYRSMIVEESQRIAEIAYSNGITVSYEFHNGTINDSNSSSLRLLKEVNHEGIKTYWQPPINQNHEYCLKGLQIILPYLTNMHVFHWRPSTNESLSLKEGASSWEEYLKIAASTHRDHDALLEFVINNDPEMVIQDALTFKYLRDKIYESI